MQTIAPLRTRCPTLPKLPTTVVRNRPPPPNTPDVYHRKRERKHRVNRQSHPLPEHTAARAAALARPGGYGAVVEPRVNAELGELFCERRLDWRQFRDLKRRYLVKKFAPVSSNFNARTCGQFFFRKNKKLT